MVERVVVFPGLSGSQSQIAPLIAALRTYDPQVVIYPDWTRVWRNQLDRDDFLAECSAQIGSLKNVAFFGYSFGGLVAFALAMQCLTTGCDAPVIGLLDTPADPSYFQLPSAPLLCRLIRAVQRGTFADLIAYRAAQITRRAGLLNLAARAPRNSKYGHALQCMFTWRIVEECQDVMAKLPAPLPLQAVLFRCVEQLPNVPFDLGWRALVQNVHIIDIPGTHHGVHQPSYTPILADALRRSRWLEAANLAPGEVG